MGRGAGFSSFPFQKILKFVGGPFLQSFLKNTEFIEELPGSDGEGIHVRNGCNDFEVIIAIPSALRFVVDVTKIEADGFKGLLVDLKAEQLRVTPPALRPP
jgi:hypothetical protein